MPKKTVKDDEQYVKLVDHFIHNHTISNTDERKQLHRMKIPLYFDYCYIINKENIRHTMHGTFYIVSTTSKSIKYYDPYNNKILSKYKSSMSDVMFVSCDYDMFGTTILNITKKY